MAHQIWEFDFKKCPRCGAEKARLASYHFGATIQAECAGCAFGSVTGDNKKMALARLTGKYLDNK